MRPQDEADDDFTIIRVRRAIEVRVLFEAATDGSDGAFFNFAPISFPAKTTVLEIMSTIQQVAIEQQF